MSVSSVLASQGRRGRHRQRGGGDEQHERRRQGLARSVSHSTHTVSSA